MKIIYLMSGPSHMPNLVVSLYSLRRHYTGPITVYAWPESWHFVRHVARDTRLNVEVRLASPNYRGKNSQFFHKIQTVKNETDQVMYLDADTMPVGKLDDLFRLALNTEFLATQFNEWTTHGGIIRNRISKLRDFPEINQDAVDNLLHNPWPWPSVNGGVFIAEPESEAVVLWEKWTSVCKEQLFIADETVLHAVMSYLVRKENNEPEAPILFSVVPEYNTSPKHKAQTQNVTDVRIWHFHGDSNLRPDKCPLGVYLWWPIYQQCLQQNVGNIQDWQVDANNKYLDKLRSTSMNSCRYCGADMLRERHRQDCPHSKDQ